MKTVISLSSLNQKSEANIFNDFQQWSSMCHASFHYERTIANVRSSFFIEMKTHKRRLFNLQIYPYLFSAIAKANFTTRTSACKKNAKSNFPRLNLETVLMVYVP